MTLTLRTAVVVLVLFNIPAKTHPADTGATKTVRIEGSVVDDRTGQLLAARIYIQAADGTWFFPTSADKNGSAVEYKKQRPRNPDSVEMHTTLSAHPFTVDLPLGNYTLTVERGKEYHSDTRKLTVGDSPLTLRIRLRRWIDLAAQGWYSGDTHVHRTLKELPTAMLADDLNVALPLLDWTTRSFISPKGARTEGFIDAEPQPVVLDKTHVYYPRNTEYELFTVKELRHTQGAFFVLNHRSVLDLSAPPVRHIAEQARQEGALIDLDKHNWPWSMMLIPVIKPDLFELSNNHIWRTEFAFPAFEQTAAEYMNAERDDKGFTERGWLEFGWQNYYSLLNCGFRMRPSAGTASGVHPVPLGFSRVYVRCPEGFSYDNWIAGLDKGRSFVTNGPILLTTIDGELPGHTFRVANDGPREFTVAGLATNGQPLDRIEIIVNGQVVRTVPAANRKTPEGAFETSLKETVLITGSSWIVLRCFERRDDSRVRFAHTGPVHIDVAGRPLRPRKVETDYLTARVREQIDRNRGILPEAAVEEYRSALEFYENLAKTAE